MKKIVLAALLALTTPATAALSDGMWFSDDMKIQVAFDGLNFTRYDPALDKFIQCKIVSWPISTPTADGECENGETHKLTIGMGTLVFDGVPLTQTLEGLD
jgi:hypothetical protein